LPLSYNGRRLALFHLCMFLLRCSVWSTPPCFLNHVRAWSDTILVCRTSRRVVPEWPRGEDRQRKRNRRDATHHDSRSMRSPHTLASSAPAIECERVSTLHVCCQAVPHRVDRLCSMRPICACRRHVCARDDHRGGQGGVLSLSHLFFFQPRPPHTLLSSTRLCLLSLWYH
jgi:hypothetical protein